MHVIEQNQLIMCDNQINQKNHLCRAPTKARLFLHEVIPQIPLIGITEFNSINSCLLKSRGAEDCLKARAELKLFGRKLDF